MKAKQLLRAEKGTKRSKASSWCMATKLFVLLVVFLSFSGVQAQEKGEEMEIVASALSPENYGDEEAGSVSIVTGYYKERDYKGNETSWKTVLLKVRITSQSVKIIATKFNGVWSDTMILCSEVHSFDPLSEQFNYKAYHIGKDIYF